MTSPMTNNDLAEAAADAVVMKALAPQTWETARKAALHALQANDWRPISEAPKDGIKFDAWIPDAFGGHRMCSLSFNRRAQLRQNGVLTPAELPRWPTHFRPLPPPPTSQETK